MKTGTNTAAPICGLKNGMTRRQFLGITAGIAVVADLPMSGPASEALSQSQPNLKPH
jgi:hypothetical protein